LVAALGVVVSRREHQQSGLDEQQAVGAQLKQNKSRALCQSISYAKRQIKVQGGEGRRIGAMSPHELRLTKHKHAIC
jgi:hypothetical protein